MTDRKQILRAARSAARAAAERGETATEAKRAALATAREALGVSRLPAGWPAAVERAALAGIEVGERVRARRAASIRRRAEAAALKTPEGAARAALLSCGYRRSESSWAGGEHRVRAVVARGRVDARGWSSYETARNHSPGAGRYRAGTNSHLEVTVGPRWLTRVQQAGIAVVDGMLTLEAQRLPRQQLRRWGIADNVEAWEASWAVQSRGFGLRVERGLIVREYGVATHVAGPLEARTVLRGQLQLSKRAEAAREAHAGFDADDLQVVVYRRDSAAAGNCATGTTDWIARHLPGRSSATVAEVLAAAAASGDRLALAQAACRVAVRRAQRAAS
jgi:hypothetical protein